MHSMFGLIDELMASLFALSKNFANGLFVRHTVDMYAELAYTSANLNKCTSGLPGNSLGYGFTRSFKVHLLL